MITVEVVLGIHRVLIKKNMVVILVHGAYGNKHLMI
jgi:hypothetical protein